MNVIFMLGGEFFYGKTEGIVSGMVNGKLKRVFLIGRYIIRERNCYFPS